MSRRRVINLPGTTHKAPIPQAVVVDDILYSSAVNGKGADGTYPDTAAAQAKLAFANMAEIVRLAGGSTDDIIRVTVFLRDRADKAVVDDEWLAMFPDPDDRPARHAVGMERGGAALLQLEFVAVLRGDRTSQGGAGMIVDAHGHTVAPAQVYEFQAKLASRRAPMKAPEISDELLDAKLKGHVKLLDEAGTDVQFISPRPYTMMHSLFSARVVRTWLRFVNDTIARQVGLYPDRFRGVAGLPQFRDTDLTPAVEELERCVTELGFVGCLLNPDPLEGQGEPPGLGDEYWYPLYAKLVELDVPALIHAASCTSERESYSLHFINEESIAVLGLVESRVFDDFPTLKIVVAHGGGAIPYQLGRFRAAGIRRGGAADMAERIKKLHYDTCVYSGPGLRLLFDVVGPDNCLFGTERPGTGDPVDPATGRRLDDLRPIIESLGLSAGDQSKIFEGNARALYPRAFAHLTSRPSGRPASLEGAAWHAS